MLGFFCDSHFYLIYLLFFSWFFIVEYNEENNSCNNIFLQCYLSHHHWRDLSNIIHESPQSLIYTCLYIYTSSCTQSFGVWSPSGLSWGDGRVTLWRSRLNKLLVFWKFDKWWDHRCWTHHSQCAQCLWKTTSALRPNTFKRGNRSLCHAAWSPAGGVCA